jgi:uncharacterized protein with HEPN domain
MNHYDRRYEDYLAVMKANILRILHYIDDMSYSQFKQNTLVQDAVIRNLEMIGEACRNIIRYTPNFLEKYPNFPVHPLYEMRNLLVHGYFEVDLVLLWRTLHQDIPHIQSLLH